MTIQQCRYVLEIAKAGSFNHAAGRLFTAQSNLSGSIKSLEQELNIKIFERSKNGVFLTAEGAEFVRYAEQIVEQSDFILNRYISHAGRQRLYVSAQHYDFVADVFCELLRELPEGEFDLSLREIRTYEVIKEVETAYCDIGIIGIKDNDFEIMRRYLDKKGIAFTQLLRVTPHVFLRRAHPLAKHAAVSYEDLRAYPYVSYEQGAHSASYFAEEPVGMADTDKRVEISDRATLMNVLLTTDGYTVGTGVMPSALNDDKIVCVPLENGAPYSVGYISRADRTLSPLADNLLKRLSAFVAQYSAKK